MAAISSTRKRVSQFNLVGIMKKTNETLGLPAVASDNQEHGNGVDSGVLTQEESVVSESCSMSRSDPEAPTISLDSVTSLCTDICCSSDLQPFQPTSTITIKDLAKSGRNIGQY